MIQLLKDLDELTVLKSYVESEALVFHNLQLLCPALDTFIDTVRRIISEITSIRDVLDSLLHNRTQAKFVQIFRPMLSNLGADVEILLFIVDEHLTFSYNVLIYPHFVYAAWTSFNLFMGKIIDRLIDGKPNHSGTLSKNEDRDQNKRLLGNSSSLCNEDDVEVEVEVENNPMRNRYFDADSRSVKVQGIHDRRLYFLSSSTSREHAEEIEEEYEEDGGGVEREVDEEGEGEEGKCYSAYDDVCGVNHNHNHAGSSVDSDTHTADYDRVADVEKGSRRKIRKVPKNATHCRLYIFSYEHYSSTVLKP